MTSLYVLQAMLAQTLIKRDRFVDPRTIAKVLQVSVVEVIEVGMSGHPREILASHSNKRSCEICGCDWASFVR